MVSFPNAKINIGLQITERRPDGFHNLESVFFPINWCDILECTENTSFSVGADKCALRLTGIPVEGDVKQNLIARAYERINQRFNLPPVNVHLHKVIPMGAGLGGGSSDAAFFIKMLNEQFNLGLSLDEMRQEAARLGSDCAFFIENSPVFATGKGEIFEPMNLSLKGYKLLVVFPGIHSNTKLAYSRVVPQPSKVNLRDFLLLHPPSDWKSIVGNDFETSIFYNYPEIEKLKSMFYDSGAIYSSLSGSGSAVFGIYPEFHGSTPPLKDSYMVFESAF